MDKKTVLQTVAGAQSLKKAADSLDISEVALKRAISDVEHKYYEKWSVTAQRALGTLEKEAEIPGYTLEEILIGASSCVKLTDASRLFSVQSYTLGPIIYDAGYEDWAAFQKNYKVPTWVVVERLNASLEYRGAEEASEALLINVNQLYSALARAGYEDWTDFQNKYPEQRRMLKAKHPRHEGVKVISEREPALPAATHQNAVVEQRFVTFEQFQELQTLVEKQQAQINQLLGYES